MSTDAAAGIVIGIDATQTVPDYEHLVPAVKQIESVWEKDQNRWWSMPATPVVKTCWHCTSGVSRCSDDPFKRMAGSDSDLHAVA